MPLEAGPVTLRVDRAVRAEVRLGLLVDGRDADRRADADVAEREADGDEDELRLVAGRHEHVAAGVDGRAVARALVAADDAGLPVHAYVCTFSTVTETLPATPTVPAPTPATTETTVSLPLARIATSATAFTVVPVPMKAFVVMLTIRTPTGTDTPADPPTATVAAMPRW